MAEDTDVALDADPSVELLGPFTINKSSVDAASFHKTIYLLVPYMGMLLGKYLVHDEEWRRL